MKKIIITFLLIINHIAFDVAADSVIKEIRCNGLQRISLDTVLLNVSAKIGMTINKDIISDCINMLFTTGYFEEITISDNSGVITITVKERPIINSIKIYKNKVIKSEIVQKILDSKNITTGNPLNNYSIYGVKQELEEICYNFGKFNATVQIIIVPLTRNRVDLQVLFSEGNFTKVNNINIIGNRSFSQKQLLKQFTLYDYIGYKSIAFFKTYQKQRLFHDLEVLRSFYLNQGYAKFCIDGTQINLISNKKSMHLSIYITEGYQYYFQSVVIRGNILSHIPEIKQYIQIKSGDLYNDKKIREIEHNIKYVLSRYGYIRPDIFIECNFDDVKKTAKLYIYVDVGNRFYVREVRFIGNDITKDFVIRREIQQIEQNRLNYINVLQDQTQLQRFSYFKTINFCIEDIPGMLNQVNLIYKIEEQCNTGNLNLSVGFGTESGLNMQIGINQENLLGTGNVISMSATKNRYQTYVDVSALKKYVGIKKISISGQLFYNNFIHNKVDLSNYNMKNYGINIRYSYPLTMYKSYDVGLNYISNNLSQIEPQIAIWRYLHSVGMNPKTMINDKNLSGNINFSANDILLISGWTFNNLNRMYFPEHGSHISITTNLTLPGSNNKYYKVTIDGHHYISIDQHAKWVLTNAIYGGYSGGLYKQKESPFYDNFYIGGIGTMRGFQLNSIGPKAAYYNCSDSDVNYSTCVVKNSFDAVGGNAIVLIKSELTVPILSYINKAEYFDLARISLFIDSGTVWDTYWKNTKMTRAAGIIDYSIFSNIRVSSGITLKWMSPIGPVMFSYSKLVKKYSGDVEEPFQFSIGKSW